MKKKQDNGNYLHSTTYLIFEAIHEKLCSQKIYQGDAEELWL